jgi:ethanolaminephosphotransferase
MGQQGWLWRPFAVLARSSLVQAVLPQFAVSLLAQLQLNQLVVSSVCSLAVLTGGQQILRVFRLAGSKQLEHTTLPKREHGHKQLGKAAAAAHIAQLALFFALGAAMLGVAAPQQLGQARVANATFGILYALQATKLIMAHMSKEPYEVTAWPLVLLAVQVANHVVPFADAALLNYSVCAVSLVLYLHYVVSMVREICAFLCIPCLTVRKVD